MDISRGLECKSSAIGSLGLKSVLEPSDDM